MKKQWIVGILLLVMAVFLVYKFAGNGVTEEENVVKIGAILPLTGAGAEFAQYIKEGIDLAVEELNANSKTKLIVKYEDSKTQPKEGVSSLQKLIVNDNPIITIVALSSVAKATAPIAVEKDKTLIFTAVAIPGVANGKNLFRIYPESNGMTGVMARYSVEKLKAKTAAIIYINDDFGRSSLEVYSKSFNDLGGEILLSESYEMMQTDFKTLLLKIKSLRKAPDVIYLSGYGPAYGTIVKQLKEAKITSTLTADMTMGLPNTLKVAGEALDGAIFVDGKMNPEFIQKYETKYSKKPTSYSGYSYDIIKIINDALKKSPDIAQGLLSMENYEGAMGKIKIEPNGESNLEFVVMKIVNGKPTFQL